MCRFHPSDISDATRLISVTRLSRGGNAARQVIQFQKSAFFVMFIPAGLYGRNAELVVGHDHKRHIFLYPVYRSLFGRLPLMI